ncbi:hypothetical protein ABZ438_08035 [Streptomyces sp. NPDC005786]|uniref:hypothetical protein n=1 Tax=Streptomyces sp. NPDC005786 TaxID=3154891 RepID=UPI00340E03B1
MPTDLRVQTGVHAVTVMLLNKYSRTFTTRQPGDTRDVWDRVADFLQDQGLLRDKNADAKIQQLQAQVRVADARARATRAHAARMTSLARAALNALPDDPTKDRAKQRLDAARRDYQAQLQQAGRTDTNS